MSKNIKPINGLVICNVVDKENKTDSGLILSDSAIEKSYIVVAKADNVTSVNIGDSIVFKKFHEEKLPNDQISIEERYILGVYDEKI